MKNYKSKLISILLILSVMLSSFAVGCASGGGEEETEASSITPAGNEETETEEETVNLYADLAEKDYGNADFRILNTDDFVQYITAEEQTGEVVNDAVFDANATVEDLANINLTSVLVSDPNPFFKQCVESGDDAFEIAMDHDCNSAKRQMAGNYMLNLEDLPYINWDAPWWPEFTTNALKFRDQIYMYSNYSTYLGNWFTRVMMCNYGMLKQLNMDDPYQLVYENKWTVDKLISMTSDTFIDTDGNGKETYEDFYGFAFTGTFYCWLEAWNIEVFRKNEAEGTIEINVEDELLVNTIEKIFNWYHDSKGVYYTPTDSGNFERDNYIGMFAGESALFTYGVIGRLLQSLMETDIEYAILPMPMMDESVGQYYSGTTDRPISVPVTASDTDMIGYIIEAMAIAGYEKILPAYCDSALKGRYSVDKDSTAMIDIIFENRILGFSYLYSNSNFPMMLDTLMKQNSLDYGSYIKKNMKSNTKYVENIVKAYDRGE